MVPFYMAGALLLGAVPTARIGGIVSKKTKAQFLHWLLSCIIFATAIKVWYDIF
jgi:uncharacterized membrane protein YfcA